LVIYKTRARKILFVAQRNHRINVHRASRGNPRSAESYCNECENVLSNLEHQKGDAGTTLWRVPASDFLFLGILISYGTIAATWLEYKLSSLLASTAVTT
jgi:hypothetical protein